MKERPILFSAPMVRALLDGTKTQTRRIVKPQPDSTHSGFPYWHVGGYRASWCRSAADGGPLEPANPLLCCYGQPGDRLWVRESWFPDPPADGTWAYAAWAGCREGQIAGVPDRFRHPAFCCYAADWLHGEVRWTPSIHMPRWASRIMLEITGVRVERLQDISEADCRAEGAHGGHGSIPGYGYSATPLEHFQHIWKSTGGDWAANPWVWVVEFQRAQAQQKGPAS
ncbi:hypothetical protein ABEW79_17965 [Delftia tsuruhatensis]|uniref:hypothetical protein n=1 Tax=Delftia tsuruhatensis TaxID=180282 RepID=UPI003D20D473